MNDNITVSLVVVKFLSKFVILDMRNSFEQTMTQHTTNQWNNKLRVKYELTLFFWSDWTAQSLKLVQMIWSKMKGIISAQLESQNKVVLLPIVNGA